MKHWTDIQIYYYTLRSNLQISPTQSTNSTSKLTPLTVQSSKTHTGVRLDDCRCIAIRVVRRRCRHVWYVAVVVVRVAVISDWCNYRLTNNAALCSLVACWAGHLQNMPCHASLSFYLLNYYQYSTQVYAR